MNTGDIKIFDTKKVRTLWNEDEEEWYFSIVDVVAVLTDQASHAGARNYWKVLKNRLKSEGNETVTNCNQLKMPAPDGKMRLTDVANTQQLFHTWSDKTTREYKRYKGLKKENLRDNMTNAELVLNMLAELSTKQISESTLPESFNEHAQAAQKGGAVARNARLELEAKTGKKVISPLNAKKSIAPKIEKK
ncbi:hypothetical protein FACS189461_3220 [Spirochaetia bacterium]|nr:hypothetical protein FACS189461_3220 [Spirochaetia bacterium]